MSFLKFVRVDLDLTKENSKAINFFNLYCYSAHVPTVIFLTMQPKRQKSVSLLPSANAPSHYTFSDNFSINDE